MRFPMRWLALLCAAGCAGCGGERDERSAGDSDDAAPSGAGSMEAGASDDAPCRPMPVELELPWPAGVEFRLSQVWNERPTHDGDFAIDVAMKFGDEVLSAAPGIVTQAIDGYRDGGTLSAEHVRHTNLVEIDHGGGWFTMYVHLRQGSLRVREGDRVGGGQVVGQVGSSGFADGPHLHFSVTDAFGKSVPACIGGIGVPRRAEYVSRNRERAVPSSLSESSIPEHALRARLMPMFSPLPARRYAAGSKVELWGRTSSPQMSVSAQFVDRERALSIEYPMPIETDLRGHFRGQLTVPEVHGRYDLRLRTQSSVFRVGSLDVPVVVRASGAEFAPARPPVRFGLWIDNHHDGGIAEFGGFVDGTPTGPWVGYWPGGGKKYEGRFARGMPIGRWVTYHFDGKTQHTVGSFSRGLRHGVWREYDRGGAEVARYSMNRGTGTYSRKRHDSGGAIKGRWVGGRRHGIWRWSSRSGLPVRELTYARGILSGRATEWHNSGHKSFELSYKDGIAEGEYRQWYPSGALRAEGTLTGGVPHGKFIAYDERGEVLAIGTYDRGRALETTVYTMVGGERVPITEKATPAIDFTLGPAYGASVP